MEPFKVKIPHDLYSKIMYFTDKSKVEVSMMARIKYDTDGDIKVTNVYVVDQINSGVETEMNDAALAKMMYETREDEGMLNCWIHSHVAMPVHWSPTDHKAIRQLGKNGFCLAIVVNKNRDIRCAYYQGNDGFKPEVFVDHIETTTVSEIPEDTIKFWADEFKQKCKTAVIVPIKTGLLTASGKDPKTRDRDWLPPHKGRAMGKKTVLKLSTIPLADDPEMWYADFRDEYEFFPKSAEQLDHFYNEYAGYSTPTVGDVPTDLTEDDIALSAWEKAHAAGAPSAINNWRDYGRDYDRI